jgi:hypothetical protein
MIFIRALIFSLSAFFLIAGLTTMVSPDVNTIFLPISADTVQEAHFCRTYAGLVAAGWLFSNEILIFLIKSTNWYSCSIYNYGYGYLKNF